MIGTISIHDLKVPCIVGIYPREREVVQDLHIDLELDIDFQPVVESNDISSTINYADVSELFTHWLQEEQFHLIEVAAEKGCQLIFERYPQALRCKIQVKKPEALSEARYVAVTIERYQKELPDQDRYDCSQA